MIMQCMRLTVSKKYPLKKILNNTIYLIIAVSGISFFLDGKFTEGMLCMVFVQLLDIGDAIKND